MSFNSQNNSEVPETHSRVTGEETEVLRHESFAILPGRKWQGRRVHSCAGDCQEGKEGQGGQR